MKRTMLCGAVAAAAIVCGCATTRSTTGQVAPGAKVAPGARVLIMRVPDVVEKGEGTVGGSGEAVTAAVRDDLMAHGYPVVTSDKSTLPDAFGEAMSLDAAYVLRGAIAEWQDNATEWSSNPDKVALSLELYEVSTKQLVATGGHRVAGQAMTFATGQTPMRFVPEMADHSLAKIFGWRPSVYHP